MNLPPVFMLFLGYATLFVIGIGPAVWLISRHNPKRVALAICVAPVVGLVETGLIFYPLILYDLLIVNTAVPVTVITVVISIGLLIRDMRHDPLAFRSIATQRTTVFVVTSFAITTFLVLLTYIVVGQRTQVGQGNPGDSSGYVTMAEYTTFVPVSYLQASDHIQDILQIDPALSVAIDGSLVLGRPAASNTLAWLSVLYHIPIYAGFSFIEMLYILFIFGTALAVCVQAKMALRWCLACALVLTIGFWTTFVTDLDALSELSALSLSLLVLFTWLCLEQEVPEKLLSRQRLFFGLALAGAMAFYPEMFMVTAAGIGFYYLITFVHRPLALRHNLHILLGIISASIIALLFQLPDLQTTLNFMFGQASGAMIPNQWAYDAFPWLFYSGQPQPFGDLWGLHLYQSNYPVRSAISNGLSWLLPFALGALGISLCAILAYGLFQALIRPTLSREHKMLAALVVAFAGTTGYFLIVRQQPWVTGKTLSMGFPFAIVALFFYADRGLQPARIFGSRVIRTAVIIWFVLQAVGPLLHTILSVNDRNYPLYRFTHSALAPEIEPALDLLTTRHMQMIGMDVTKPSGFLSIIWTYAITDIAKVSWLPGGAYSFGQVSKYYQNSDTVPDGLLMSPNRDFLSPLILGHTLVSNTNYVLSAVTPDDLDQALMFPSLLNPQAAAAVELFDSDPAYLAPGQLRPTRWTIRRDGSGLDDPNQDLLRFWASGHTLFAAYLRYSPNFTGSLEIGTNGTPVLQQTIDSAYTQQAVFCVGKPGINTVTLSYTVKSLLGIGRVDQRLLLRDALIAPNGKLNVGSPAEQLLIGDGWYGPEQWDSTKVRWSGQNSRFIMLTCSPPSTLRFRAFVAQGETRSVTVTLNGNKLGTVKLEAGWHEYSLPIPAGIYHINGEQIIDLSHDTVDTPPNDTRAISAAYEWFALQ